MRFRSLLVWLVFTLFSLTASANDVVAAQLPIDLSPQSLYQHAHPVVKAVVIILLLCSVITWAVFFVKAGQVYSARKQVRQQLQLLAEQTQFHSLQAVFSAPSFTKQAIAEIQAELTACDSKLDDDFASRVEFRLSRLSQNRTQSMRSGLAVLATIGSVTPFIGLFGTVWGIMNSFIGIAQTRTTDLLAVAPGIAEALFATALGLVAAIPAVIIYNLFIRATNHYNTQLQQLSGNLQLIVRRDLSLNRLH